MNTINFIKDNIQNKTVDHNLIIDYLDEHQLEYIQNKNGIFFIINKLSETHRENLVKLIQTYKSNIDYIQKDTHQFHEIIQDNKKKLTTISEKKSSYKSLSVDFTEKERYVLETSVQS